MASQPAEPDYSLRRSLQIFVSSAKRFLKILFFELRGEDKARKFHEYHLVVAALIAAVTFQACVNPPGGVWQEDLCLNVTKHEVSCSDVGSQQIRHAGRAVYASDKDAFFVFLAFNTLAFSTSMHLLVWLTWSFPFFFEVVIAMVSMGITYGASIFAITPTHSGLSRSLLSIAAFPVIARAAILIYKYVTGKWPPSQ